MIGIVRLFVALFALLLGFPDAFTFGGISLIFGVWAEGMDQIVLMLYRIQSPMENTMLMAAPMLVFMGPELQTSKRAEPLLESLGS
ncbi:C4-dicarboxylate ABC transporter, partial [Vibrio parahaemolyticus]